MKKMLFLIFLLSLKGLAEKGCLDARRFGPFYENRCTPNDAGLREVKCDCPCRRYSQLYERGVCSRCGHYHIPRPMNEEFCMVK